MINRENLPETVRRGNLRRDTDWLQQGLAFIPTYVANGTIGGLVDEFGLHSRCNYDTNNGRTHVAHVEHFSHRHDNGGHLLRSLFNMKATGFRGEAPGLGLVESWEQELDLWTATCTTKWAERGSRFETRVFASWDMPHLWVWEMDQNLAESADGLTLHLEFDVRTAENNSRNNPNMLMHDLEIAIEATGENLWKVVSKTDCRTSELLFHIEGGEVNADGSVLTVKAGPEVRLRLLFLDAKLPDAVKADPGGFLKRTDHRERHAAAAIHHWENSGMLCLPDGTPEASWWPLYAYYLPAVLSSEPTHILVADGLTANNWGHGFPQDQWYVMLPVARLGLKALNEAQMPYYNDDLEAYRRYSRRIARREGVYYPWAAPFENLDEFEKEGPTNPDTYEFHNSAYVFAMVWESYRVHGDTSFLEKHFDLLEGVAEFFLGNIEFPDDANGKAVFRNGDVQLRSQDEAVKHGAETVQPICSVYSSLYCLPRYLAASEKLQKGRSGIAEKARKVLEAGFDWEPLIREDGTLRTSATDERPLGLQKHPIQFNPLTYLPMADWMDWAPVHETWKKRHFLCKLTRVPTSLGWTFGQLAFSSARMRDGAAVEHDLGLVQRARYADPMWIQFYECSHRWGWTERIAFYFVTMQIYTKTILECVVQDCREAIEFFPALLPRWQGKPLAFTRMHLRDGLVAEGEIDGTGSLEIRLHATLDCETPVRVLAPGAFSLRTDAGEISFASGDAVDLRLAAGESATIRGS